MRVHCIIPCVASAGLFVFAGIADAGILTGSVSFNPITDLFTYSYTLNNTSGPATVSELSILVERGELANPGVAPTAHTGAHFNLAFGGVEDEYGTFWEWQVSVPVGRTRSGFSFTTPQSPVLNSANNYFLFSNKNNSGFIEFGHVTAPDFSAPEPGTCGLIAFALPLLARLGSLGSSTRDEV